MQQINNISNIARMLRIIWVMARNDALFPFADAGIAPNFISAITYLARFTQKKYQPHNQPCAGARLSMALQELGPSFIKLGQALSTRSDLIGEQIAAELAELRDKLPPFPAAQAHEIVAKEFGKPIGELFEEFSDQPIAAASIAQVHFAITKSGKAVAVKILRPNIERAFERDLQLFFWLAQLAENKKPHLKRLRLVEVVQSLAETIKMELDLRFEAAAAMELRQNMVNDDNFYVPEIYWSLTSKRVLVMERICGIAVSDIDALLAAGHNRQHIMQIAAQSLFNMVFRDGFFHADLHPGNLFVLPDGRLAVVDFGIMGRITLQERIYIAEILHGFLNADYKRVAEVHFEAGYVPANQSVHNFALACAAIGAPILGKPLAEISIARLLAQLFKVAETFAMETQPQLLLLQKTMMMAEGVGRMLDPSVNMWQLAEPLIEQWTSQYMTPLARMKMQLHSLEQAIKQVPDTVQRANKILQQIETEGVKLHPDSAAAIKLANNNQNYTSWIIVAIAAIVIITGMLAGILQI